MDHLIFNFRPRRMLGNMVRPLLRLPILLLVLLSFLFHSATAQSNASGAPFGDDTIWAAAQDGDLEQVKKLVSANPQLVNAIFTVNLGTPEEDDWTPLSLAAIAGKLKVTDYLITKGASLKSRRSNGSTLLQDVILWGDNTKNRLSILSLLLSRGADANGLNRGGLAPLHYASDLKVAKLLIDNGARINDHQNTPGITPLHALVRYEQRELLKDGKIGELLDLIRLHVKHGANLQYKDKLGRSLTDHTSKITDPKYRKRVLSLLKSLGAK